MPASPLPPNAPQQNHLLAALPAADLRAKMPLGEILYEPGDQIQHAYFPTTAIVSLHHMMVRGATTEAAGVGPDGVVGISLFMSEATTSSSAIVQTAAYAYRLARYTLMQEFNRAGLMQRLLLRYMQALITEMIQTSACNHHHTVEQQLFRWLPLTLDRLPSRELVMTHELVATMLGVRRKGRDGGSWQAAARRL